MITFYSGSGGRGAGGALVPGETCAMNYQQMAEMGIGYGTEVYVISGRGYSGVWRVVDTGCAYGTIDLFVPRGTIPRWGVERGVRLAVV